MKKLMNKYFNLCLWFAANQNSGDYSVEQFKGVLEKIGEAEDELRKQGLSEKEIQKIIDQVALSYKGLLIYQDTSRGALGSDQEWLELPLNIRGKVIEFANQFRDKK